MYRQIILLLLFCLISYSSICQNIDLKWSPEKKYQRSNDDLGYVGRVGSYFYTLRKQDKTMYLSKTRISDMNVVFEKEIRWNGTSKNPNDDLAFKSFRLFKDYFVFYFESSSNKESTQRIYAQKIDLEGAPFDPLVEIGTRPKERRNKDGSFQLAYSPDSANFLLITNPSYEKYNNERFFFKVISKKLETLYQADITLPFADKNFTVESFILGKDQLIYILAKIDLPRKSKNDDEPDYYYEVVTVDPKEKNKVTGFDIKLDNRYVDKVDIILNNKDELKCFGFYADMQGNGRRKSGINGIFYFSVVDNQASNISVKAFDLRMVFEIEAETKQRGCFGKRAPKAEKGLAAFFNLRAFFAKPDGGMIVVAEKSYIRVVTTSNGNGGTTTTYYYVDYDILTTNIDASGNIAWYAHVPKKQVVANDNRFGSIHAMYTGGKVYLIYNDEPENAANKTYKNVMRNYIKAVPVVVTINEQGKIDKKIIGKDSRGKNGFTLKPRISDTVSSNEAFFYADRLSKACCVIGRLRAKATRYGILTVR
ncbi:MAG: hypothetical protein WDO14_19190 [Bacteroidota bacterium]